MVDNQQGDSSVLTALFAHNVWANLKLLDFCERLSDEQLDATAIGGFWLHTRHIAAYHQRRGGVLWSVSTAKLPAAPPQSDQFPGFAVLKEAARWAGGELLQLALSAREEPAFGSARLSISSSIGSRA